MCERVHVSVCVHACMSVSACAVHNTLNKCYYCFYTQSFMLLFSSAAEVRKDVSGQFHNAICCGDVEERIKVLRSVGQGTYTDKSIES